MRRYRTITAVSGFVLLSGVLAGCGGSGGDGSNTDGPGNNGSAGDSAIVTGIAAGPDEPQYDDARLIMPHRALEVTSSEASTEVSAERASELDLGDAALEAAEDEEFVVVTIATGDAPFEADGSDTVEITTEQDTYDITADIDEASDQLLELAVAVRVPTDSPVALSITDEDKTAELDVRTGERSDETNSGATGGYYVGWSGELSGELLSTGVLAPTDPAAEPGGPSDVSVTLSLDNVEPRADGWLGGEWAPDGQAFLLLFGVQSSEQIPGVGCPAELDLAASLSFTPEGGAAASPVGFDPETGEVRDDLDGPMAFAIPVETTSGVLSLNPQVTAGEGCQFTTPMSAAELPITLK